MKNAVHFILQCAILFIGALMVACVLLMTYLMALHGFWSFLQLFQ